MQREEDVEVRKLTFQLNDRPVNILVPVKTEGGRKGRMNKSLRERYGPKPPQQTRKQREAAKSEQLRIAALQNAAYHQAVKDKYAGLTRGWTPFTTISSATRTCRCRA